MLSEKRRSVLPLGVAAVSAVVSIAVTLHDDFFLYWIWVLYLPLFAFGYLILAIVFVVLLRCVTRSGSRGLSVATAALAVVGIGGSLFLFVDTEAGGWARFWLEYPAFAAAATVEVPEHGEGDLYGVELPSHLCVVAPNCRIANLGYSNGAPIRYAADYVDVAKHTYGYRHFAGTPEPGPYNGFGIPGCPTMELAGGWWWLERCDGPEYERVR
ncbi:hypothetical protein [Nocardia brevicatena]|uniref:hypothetical protein n=1 Tax=Nocardia brevicatena TaxID=37327 RepID=UPI0012F8F15B|nr:hypothetical protein [Nocardia brevicatena]